MGPETRFEIRDMERGRRRYPTMGRPERGSPAKTRQADQDFALFHTEIIHS